MIEKILVGLIRKERLIAMAISFLLGMASSALGLNIDSVYKEICSGQAGQSQLTQD